MRSVFRHLPYVPRGGAIRGACHQAALRADPVAIAPYILGNSGRLQNAVRLVGAERRRPGEGELDLSYYFHRLTASVVGLGIVLRLPDRDGHEGFGRLMLP